MTGRASLGGERQLILVARTQAEAYLGHSSTARPGNRTKPTVAVYRKTPVQQRSDRRLKYLRSHTDYAQLFGWARTAHLEAYKYWRLPRRLGVALAVGVFTAGVATGLDWKLSASITVALTVVWLFVEPVLVKVRAAQLGASFDAAQEQSRHIPARLRDQVLKHDGRRCRKCGSREALSVDHVVPYSRGGPTEFSNLRTLCMPCNIKKGKPAPHPHHAIPIRAPTGTPNLAIAGTRSSACRRLIQAGLAAWMRNRSLWVVKGPSRRILLSSCRSCWSYRSMSKSGICQGTILS